MNEQPAPQAPPATSESSSGYDTATVERIERDFGEVEAALTRLDESRYGLCEVTGDPIADELLAADPVRRHGSTVGS